MRRGKKAAESRAVCEANLPLPFNLCPSRRKSERVNLCRRSTFSHEILLIQTPAAADDDKDSTQPLAAIAHLVWNLGILFRSTTTSLLPSLLIWDCKVNPGTSIISSYTAQTPTVPAVSGVRTIITLILRTCNLITIACGRWSLGGVARHSS